MVRGDTRVEGSGEEDQGPVSNIKKLKSKAKSSKMSLEGLKEGLRK